MEKSSRESIQHKIRSKEDGPPDVQTLSEELCVKLNEHFNKDKSGLSKMARMKAIYAMLNQICDEISEFTVCRKGCAHCCRIDLDITPLEADYISHNTVIKQRKKPIERDDEYCPFLDKETAVCTIYDFRPFNCRTFATFDSPDYCRDDQSHLTTGGPVQGYGSKAKWFLALEMIEVDTGMKVTKELMKIVEDRVKDIRKFF